MRATSTMTLPSRVLNKIKVKFYFMDWDHMAERKAFFMACSLQEGGQASCITPDRILGWESRKCHDMRVEWCRENRKKHISDCDR